MKKIIYMCLLSAMFLTTSHAQYGTERTGYEGDYFSLEGAIELFKESRSIRNFENRLNNEDSWVNNLDLNYDGEIDYIRVEHRNQGDFHAIILQATLGRRDVQDVAVIEIEQTGRRSAVLQIIGDPDLYGEEVIAEPFNSAGYSSRGDYDFSRGYVNVYNWRAVQHILGRSYVTYVSPYRWNYYPTYWSPWRQHGWSIYHPRRVRYFNNCHIVYVHRVVRVHNFYRPHRIHSRNVAQRTVQHRRKYGSSVAHRTQGKKQNTYRRPTNIRNSKVTAPRNTGARTTTSTRKSAPNARSVSNSRTRERNGNISRNSNRSSDAGRSASPAKRETRSSVQTQRRSSETQRSQQQKVKQQSSGKNVAKTRTSNRSTASPARSQQSKAASKIQKSQTRSSSSRSTPTAKKSSTSKKASTKTVRKGRGN